MFFHFGINTFTNSEWGSGHESPRLFFPTGLNTTQWVHVAKAAGASLVILTAKHHDGFCLWPSAYTGYSVKSSPWMRGHGDVVAELAAAAKDEGVDLGLYLSPWDRHDRRYGHTKAYNEYYMAQLHEILTRYGAISEVWFDGAKGAGAPKMSYMFKKWFALTHELQAKINIFSDAGPDVRWVGDENGYCGSTCWSMMNQSNAKIGAGANPLILNMGDPHGKDWVPAECDVSIRRGWFWHRDEKPKTPQELLDIYYTSAGRNCVLLLNAPPNSTGLLAEEDVKALLEFRRLRDAIFGHDLVAGNASMKVWASSERGRGYEARNVVDGKQGTYWAPSMGKKQGRITLKLRELTQFNVVELKEEIGLGQRVQKYRIRVRVTKMYKNNQKILWHWQTFSIGTTIGFRKLDRGCLFTASHVQLAIDKARSDPLIAGLSLFLDASSPTLPSCK